MFTANLVDTGLFRAIGKPPNAAFDSLARAVRSAGVTLRVPPTIYAELGGDWGSDPPSGSPYIDRAVREGWVMVTDPVPGSPDAVPEADTTDAVVARARHDTHRAITEQTNHPQTANEWADTSLVGLAVRLFEANERIRILLHTTDRALAKAARIVTAEYGYYDFRTRSYRPRAVKQQFPRPRRFEW